MLTKASFTGVMGLCLMVMLGAMPAAEIAAAASVPPRSNGQRWKSVILWDTPVLSATLNYMPEPSLADEDYMYLEFNNHTRRTLDVAQAYLGLPGTRLDRATKASVFMGDMTSGVVYIGKLPPGKTRANQHGVFECGLANLGLPPVEGFQVDLTAKADVRLADGRAFSTPSEGVKFGFLWRYPRKQEMESMRLRIKELLADPRYEFAHGYRLRSLAGVPEVGEAPSFGELLAARNSRQNSVDGRDSVVGLLATRFADYPALVQLYEEELKEGNPAAIGDLLSAPLWNSTWTAPMVALFEKSGQRTLLQILASHRSDWATNEGYVERLAASLMHHRPVLQTNVTTLGASELYSWCEAANEAGVVGAKSLVPFLKPGLDDKRIAAHPQEARLAFTPPKRRVCDAALYAILTILDGSPAEALMRAADKVGAEDAGTNTEAIADFCISGLKHRLARD